MSDPVKPPGSAQRHKTRPSGKFPFFRALANKQGAILTVYPMTSRTNKGGRGSKNPQMLQTSHKYLPPPPKPAHVSFRKAYLLPNLVGRGQHPSIPGPFVSPGQRSELRHEFEMGHSGGLGQNCYADHQSVQCRLAFRALFSSFRLCTSQFRLGECRVEYHVCSPFREATRVSPARDSSVAKKGKGGRDLRYCEFP